MPLLHDATHPHRISDLHIPKAKATLPHTRCWVDIGLLRT